MHKDYAKQRKSRESASIRTQIDTITTYIRLRRNAKICVLFRTRAYIFTEKGKEREVLALIDTMATVFMIKLDVFKELNPELVVMLADGKWIPVSGSNG